MLKCMIKHHIKTAINTKIILLKITKFYKSFRNQISINKPYNKNKISIKKIAILLKIKR